MQNIIKHLTLLISIFVVSQLQAQDTLTVAKQDVSKMIEDYKERIKKAELETLKEEVDNINDRLDREDITFEEAEKLKKEAAEKHAKNIENRYIILENKFELMERNNDLPDPDKKSTVFSINIGDGQKEIVEVKAKKTPPKNDIRTGNQLLFAMGFNNAIIDGVSLDDSPYKLGGSGFVELGWLWNTRVFKESNFLRFKYGLSFQWNKFDIKDNLYFEKGTEETTLQVFPNDLKKAKFRTTNLVIPVFFEFGPSTKKEYKDRIRYFTDDHFKIGIGGYGGVNLGTQQKLVYEDEFGDRVKQKIKTSYNTNTFVYGLAAYIGYGDLSLYAKYDLSTIFKDATVDQNNISLGIRVDLD